MFYLLSGTAEFRCDGQALHAGPGDFVLLPAGLPHAFLVGAGEPLRALQITTPAGSEDFAAGARRTRAPAAAPGPRAGRPRRSRPRRRAATNCSASPHSTTEIEGSRSASVPIS